MFAAIERLGLDRRGEDLELRLKLVHKHRMNFVIDEGEELSGRPAKYDVAIADGSGPSTFQHSRPRIDHRQRAALIERDDSLHPELGMGISLQQLVNAATHLIDVRALTKG